MRLLRRSYDLELLELFEESGRTVQRATMLLRDVLALSAGVVVELDNTLHSPVDLLLDGRLIAQGEVVIVDGKYGLRITDVVDPSPAMGSPV